MKKWVLDGAQVQHGFFPSPNWILKYDADPYGLIGTPDDLYVTNQWSHGQFLYWYWLTGRFTVRYESTTPNGIPNGLTSLKNISMTGFSNLYASGGNLFSNESSPGAGDYGPASVGFSYITYDPRGITVAVASVAAGLNAEYVITPSDYENWVAAAIIAKTDEYDFTLDMVRG